MECCTCKVTTTSVAARLSKWPLERFKSLIGLAFQTRIADRVSLSPHVRTTSRRHHGPLVKAHYPVDVRRATRSRRADRGSARSQRARPFRRRRVGHARGRAGGGG